MIVYHFMVESQLVTTANSAEQDLLKVFYCNFVIIHARESVITLCWARVWPRNRAVARALIGGLNIHVVVLCPTNFF